MNNYLLLTKNFDGWAKMSDGWANALPCPPLATPMILPLDCYQRDQLQDNNESYMLEVGEGSNPIYLQSAYFAQTLIMITCA